VRRLSACGFTNISVQSIKNDVFPGATKYAALRKAGVPMDSAVIELTREEIDGCFGIENWEPTGLTDYVIFGAQKPA
jgi:hypothetical protein